MTDVYAGVAVGGLGRSLDGGATWTECHGPLLARATQEHPTQQHGPHRAREGLRDTHALARSAAQPGTRLLATRLGLFRSDDKGASWSAMDLGRCSPLTYARDGKGFPHDTQSLLGALNVTAVRDARSLYRSAALGAPWTRFDHDGSSSCILMSLAASAQTPERGYGAARRGQGFGTEDGGKRWQTSPLPAEGVYARVCGSGCAPPLERRTQRMAYRIGRGVLWYAPPVHCWEEA